MNELNILMPANPVVLVGEGYDKNNNKVAVVSADNFSDNMSSLVLNEDQAKIVVERLKQMFDL